jgi:hypothetical protein
MDLVADCRAPTVPDRIRASRHYRLYCRFAWIPALRVYEAAAVPVRRKDKRAVADVDAFGECRVAWIWIALAGLGVTCASRG